MTKRTHRATSKEAHESVKEHKALMYEKIKAGMEKLKVGGTSEEIAAACKMKHEQVWKRLSEMVDIGMIYNVGVTRIQSSGRKAMVRQLTGLGYKEGEKSPVIDKPKKQLPIITNPLFVNI